MPSVTFPRLSRHGRPGLPYSRAIQCSRSLHRGLTPCGPLVPQLAGFCSVYPVLSVISSMIHCLTRAFPGASSVRAIPWVYPVVISATSGPHLRLSSCIYWDSMGKNFELCWQNGFMMCSTNSRKIKHVSRHRW